MIGFRLVGSWGETATVTRSTREAGWQVTYFDRGEPTGHSTRATVHEALHLVMSEGSKIVESRGDGADAVARTVQAYIDDSAKWLDAVTGCAECDLGLVLASEPHRPW